MKTIFVIPSAIATKHSKFSHDQRLEQSINALASLRQRVPDPYVIFLDASMERSLNQTEISSIMDYADTFINLHDDAAIRAIYESTTSHDIVKNQSELIILSKGFSYARRLEGYDRVFKLSGRYELTDHFALDFYSQDHIKDKFVVLRRLKSQFPPYLTGGITEQFMCRLYSFPFSKVVEVMNTHVNMFTVFTQNIQKKIYIDLEHNLFKHFGNLPETYEMERIGVRGNLGPNGAYVED